MRADLQLAGHFALRMWYKILRCMGLLTEKNKQRVLWPLVADVSGYASRGVWQTFGDTAMRSQHRHFANGVVDLFIEAGDANGNIDRFRYSMESFCLKP